MEWFQGAGPAKRASALLRSICPTPAEICSSAEPQLPRQAPPETTLGRAEDVEELLPLPFLESNPSPIKGSRYGRSVGLVFTIYYAKLRLIWFLGVAMRVLCLVLMFVACPAWGQMYRCNTPEGTTYQDRPCAAGSAKGTYTPPPITSQSGQRIDNANAKRARPTECLEISNAGKLRSALEMGQQCTDRCMFLNKDLVIGLSRSELESLCGLPDTINSSGRGGEVHSQYVYRRLRDSYYFYFDGDKLTSWSD